MTFAPATLILVVLSFAVGALFGWVLQRASARQALARLRQAMAREVTRLQDRLDQCTEDLTAETRSLGQARNQGEELRAALAGSESERLRLEEQLERVPALETTVERLTNGIRASADELRRLRTSNGERAQALDALQASASESAAELLATQLKLNETSRSLSEAQTQNARLEEGLVVARRVADVAREQVDALAVAEQRVRKLEGQVRTLRSERGPAHGSRPVLVSVPDPFAAPAPRFDARSDDGEASAHASETTTRRSMSQPPTDQSDADAGTDGDQDQQAQRDAAPTSDQEDATRDAAGVARTADVIGTADKIGTADFTRTADAGEAAETGTTATADETGAAARATDGSDGSASTTEPPSSDRTGRSTQGDFPGRDRTPPLPLEQLVDVLGAGLREMARRWDQAMAPEPGNGESSRPQRDSFGRFDEQAGPEPGRFARGFDEAGRDDEARPPRSLFERLLGEVLDEVRRERRR